MAQVYVDISVDIVVCTASMYMYEERAPHMLLSVACVVSLETGPLECMSSIFLVRRTHMTVQLPLCLDWVCLVFWGNGNYFLEGRLVDSKLSSAMGKWS